MPFPVTIQGTMMGVLNLEPLRHSKGLEIIASAGVIISWESDTVFKIVLPSNENIGTQIQWSFPKYHYTTWTQTQNLVQTMYSISHQMQVKHCIVSGIVTEKVTNEELVDFDIKVTEVTTQKTYPVVDVTEISVLGFYVILPPGVYNFEFSKRGYFSDVKQVTVSPGDTLENCGGELELKSGKYFGSVTGSVLELDGNNTPISGCTVRAFSYTTTTDANGYYSLTLPVGNYSLSFTKNKYISERKPISILAGRSFSYQMRLEKVFISGTLEYEGADRSNIRLDLFSKNTKNLSLDTIFVNGKTFEFGYTPHLGTCRIHARWYDVNEVRWGGVSHWFEVKRSGEKKIGSIVLKQEYPLGLSADELAIFDVPRFVSGGTLTPVNLVDWREK